MSFLDDRRRVNFSHSDSHLDRKRDGLAYVCRARALCGDMLASSWHHE
jgi:hypothetical protein